MGVLNVAKPDWWTEELDILETAVEKFADKEIVPYLAQWDEEGICDRELWYKAGEAGLLCASIPDEFGGGGGTFAHDATIIDVLSKKGITSWGGSLHSAIIAPYYLHYGTEDQKQKWLPGMATGEIVNAIAMTEPGTGSDLQAIKTTAKRDGDSYVINGSKTYISNGQTANLILVVAKTDPSAGSRGVSLIAVETDKVEGFQRGRNLDKIGLKGQDTSELFFEDVRVPASNILGGEEGKGFFQLMEQLPSERHQIALGGIAAIEYALAETIEFTKGRAVFGKPIADYQNTQFKLAECKTEATVARVFCNYCTGQLIKGELDAATASMSKYWVSDIQNKIIDECLQLHGGAGYMNEYPIARLFRDARVQKIHGGTNEIMKVLISRTL